MITQISDSCIPAVPGKIKFVDPIPEFEKEFLSVEKKIGR